MPEFTKFVMKINMSALDLKYECVFFVSHNIVLVASYRKKNLLFRTLYPIAGVVMHTIIFHGGRLEMNEILSKEIDLNNSVLFSSLILPFIWNR